jgi:TonB family protein
MSPIENSQLLPRITMLAMLVLTGWLPLTALAQSSQASTSDVTACGSRIQAQHLKLPDKMKGRSLNLHPSLRFSIGEDGKVVDVRVTKSTKSRELDDFIVNQVKNWKFASKPGCGVIDSSLLIIIDVR